MLTWSQTPHLPLQKEIPEKRKNEKPRNDNAFMLTNVNSKNSHVHLYEYTSQIHNLREYLLRCGKCVFYTY